eukprot:TRINITY_DN12615_c0_g1_i1.p4 TRINITY_DN12615_c0_g1~~TRINITY_DN12615_c0_g1_i1.p4  ORF type:complete len:50 (-),score=5.76 TRINITY_DN12615_c0_g1_i1:10-159(-)
MSESLPFPAAVSVPLGASRPTPTSTFSCRRTMPISIGATPFSPTTRGET